MARTDLQVYLVILELLAREDLSVCEDRLDLPGLQESRESQESGENQAMMVHQVQRVMWEI